MIKDLQRLGKFVRSAINGDMQTQAAQTALFPFQYSPFPLANSGLSIAPDGKPFFDVEDHGRRGHQSLRGGVYWEDETYSDNRVLISPSPCFDPAGSPLILVYLHGNQTQLERDVRDRQRVPEQLAKSGLNAVLLAPQLAFDAQDSSPGRFAEQDFFGEFLEEAFMTLATWLENDACASQLRAAKILLVAYSGGYQAAANALRNGGVNEVIAGVVLLDALYGCEEYFADFMREHGDHSFFLSLYTEGSASYNDRLRSLVGSPPVVTGLPDKLSKGSLTFVRLDRNVDHFELVNRGWTNDPITDILRRIDDECRVNL